MSFKTLWARKSSHHLRNCTKCKTCPSWTSLKSIVKISIYCRKAKMLCWQLMKTFSFTCLLWFKRECLIWPLKLNWSQRLHLSTCRKVQMAVRSVKHISPCIHVCSTWRTSTWTRKMPLMLDKHRYRLWGRTPLPKAGTFQMMWAWRVPVSTNF